jgi:hypothetical protein
MQGPEMGLSEGSARVPAEARDEAEAVDDRLLSGTQRTVKAVE